MLLLLPLLLLGVVVLLRRLVLLGASIPAAAAVCGAPDRVRMPLGRLSPTVAAVSGKVLPGGACCGGGTTARLVVIGTADCRRRGGLCCAGRALTITDPERAREEVTRTLHAAPHSKHYQSREREGQCWPSLEDSATCESVQQSIFSQKAASSLLSLPGLCS